MSKDYDQKRTTTKGRGTMLECLIVDQWNTREIIYKDFCKANDPEAVGRLLSRLSFKGVSVPKKKAGFIKDNYE